MIGKRFRSLPFIFANDNYTLRLEVLIPDDDPVRLLSAFVEELELTDLYRSYGKIKKGQVTGYQFHVSVRTKTRTGPCDHCQVPLPSFIPVFEKDVSQSDGNTLQPR